MKPLVGVSTSEVRRPDPPREELALGRRYPDAVRMAGAIPVILTPVAALDDLLDRLDAVCLSGGPDVHPSAYGAEPHPELGPTEPELDRFELALARRAFERRVPLLGICRGSQVLNVALGGTLHQHVPEHRHDDGHDVALEPRSRLAALLGGSRVEVNTLHHQAVDRLGHGLRAVATAPDGTIEATEAADGRFAFGVQWHAECLVHRPEHLGLFEALADAARGRPLARAA